MGRGSEIGCVVPIRIGKLDASIGSCTANACVNVARLAQNGYQTLSPRREKSVQGENRISTPPSTMYTKIKEIFLTLEFFSISAGVYC